LRSNSINVQQLQKTLQAKLVEARDELPAHTSLLLLQHVLNLPKTYLLAHGEYQPSPEEIVTLQNCLDQYLQGFPLPYILGHWEFFGRDFKVAPGVLIPRPETELLVEKALAFVRQIKHPKIVDVGTGSGVIAISLAAELPDAALIATDISKAALAIAQENARQHLIQPIPFIQTDLILPFRTHFDLICANLPYIPSSTLDTLPVSRWEPRLALDGGQDGLQIIRQLLAQAQTRISTSGKILLEIESGLGQETLRCARQAFPTAACTLIQDLAGKDRIVDIQLP